MSFFQSIIIAITEGLTEFLPISSTAHMKFVQSLMGIKPGPFENMFEVVIQLAAILAVVVIYFKKFFNFSRPAFYIKLIIAVIPALIVGYFLKKYIDSALSNPVFIACVMIGGGVLFLFVDNLFKNPQIDSEQDVSYGKSFIIGCGQVLSIVLPGFSRSAATILTGMSQRLTRSAAAEFSFFLAVPTMLAASAKSFMDTYKTNPEVLTHENITILLMGSLVAFVVAMLAIRFFISFLKKHGFRVWGVYRIIIGTVMLFLVWKGIAK